MGLSCWNVRQSDPDILSAVGLVPCRRTRPAWKASFLLDPHAKCVIAFTESAASDHSRDAAGVERCPACFVSTIARVNCSHPAGCSTTLAAYRGRSSADTTLSTAKAP